MIYLIVGKIVDGNNVKSYIVMSENGNTQLIRKTSILKFCRDNDVLNVNASKNGLTGKGIMLSNIPKYKDTGMFGMQQVGGMSQAEVIQLAQPYIEKYKQDKINKQSKQDNNNDKTKQEQYVLNKIDIIELLINYALKMKNITNEMASNGDFTRYIKQIDIDNAEGESLDNIIKRQGVNGLANGLLDRLNKLKNRVKKFGLNNNLLVMIEHLENECEQLRKLHSETKQIIKQNKDRENIEEKEVKQLENTIEKENLDAIPVVDDAHIDAIEISAPETHIENIEDIFGDIPIVDDADENGILVPLEDELENIEKLDISSVLDELFLSHDGYSTQNRSSKNGITAEYRSWDNFGMSVASIITIIYKGTDNKFMVEASIPPMYKVKGYNVDSFKFPGDYAVKITRDSIDEAKTSLQNYINNTVQVYTDADRMLSEQCQLSKQLLDEIDTARKSLLGEYISYALNGDDNTSFVDYIKDGLINRAKNALKTWDNFGINPNLVLSTKVKNNLDLLIREIRKTEEQYTKEQEKQQAEERRQIHKNGTTYSYEDNTFKEQLDNIIDKADDMLYSIDRISESLSDMYSSYREYASGEYISPFVKRAETILLSIFAKFSSELHLNKECNFHTRKELRAGAWFAGADFDELNDEANQCTEYIEEIISQLADCINSISSLSSKTIDNLQSLYNELLDINVDDSDRYDLNPDSNFNSIYLDFLGEAYNSGDYGGIRGKIKVILDSIEECIERCRETLVQDNNNSEREINTSHISSKDLDEALRLFDDI
mgnify:CR=1 FL=1